MSTLSWTPTRTRSSTTKKLKPEFVRGEAGLDRQSGLAFAADAAAQHHLAGAIGVEPHAGELPAAELSLDRQLRRGGEPVDVRWQPQRRVLVAHEQILHPGTDQTPVLHVLFTSVSPGTRWASR